MYCYTYACLAEAITSLQLQPALQGVKLENLLSYLARLEERLSELKSLGKHRQIFCKHEKSYSIYTGNN